MKIVIITNLYPPYLRGGAEIVLTRIVTELLASGHKIHVITTRPYGGTKTLVPRLEEKSNERIYRYYPLNFYHSLRDYKHPAPLRLLWHIIDMFNPFNAIVVRRLLKEIQPDVVWTNNLKGIGLMIPRAIRSCGLPHVHHVHDVQLSVPSGLIIAGSERSRCCIRFARGVYTRICRWLMGSPTVVLSPSRFLQEFYQARRFFPKSDVRVMMNPAPHTRYLPRLVRSTGSMRLLFVGQLEEHKGIRFLIESLKASHVPFELTIAGEGSLSAFIQSTAKQDRRFNYVGFLAMDQLVKLFQISDALVVPSLCYENSPTVIYEALQSGLPVVAADIGGVAELIREGENGFLFAAGDKNDLLSTLSTIDAEKDHLFATADAIRATVADLAMEKYVARLTELFGGISKKKD